MHFLTLRTLLFFVYLNKLVCTVSSARNLFCLVSWLPQHVVSHTGAVSWHCSIFVPWWSLFIFYLFITKEELLLWCCMTVGFYCYRNHFIFVAPPPSQDSRETQFAFSCRDLHFDLHNSAFRWLFLGYEHFLIWQYLETSRCIIIYLHCTYSP